MVGPVLKLKMQVLTGHGKVHVQVFFSNLLEIGSGQSKSLEISFQTDPLMRTQDIPVEISFDEYNSYVPPAINAKLYVVEASRPKFDYAYQIVDGGTGVELIP